MARARPRGTAELSSPRVSKHSPEKSEFRTATNPVINPGRTRLGHVLITDRNKPYSIICTHFHGLRNLLPAELAITYCTFDYVLDAGSVIFLYKLKEVDAVGTGGCSRALATANRVGIPRRIVERAAEVTRWS